MKGNSYISRVISLIIYLFGLYAIFDLTGHSILSGSYVDLLLFSSLAVLTINLFIVEHFFETPKDVIGASINAMIILIPLYNNELFSSTLFNFLFCYYLSILVISIGSVLFLKKDGIPSTISNFLKKLSISIGKSKLIFSFLIFFLLIEFYKTEEVAFYSFVMFYLLILSSEHIRQGVIEIISFIKKLILKRTSLEEEPIGRMTAVQSADTFIIDLFDINKRPGLNLFDFVEFKYGTEGNIVKGFVIDIYFLDSKQKIKVLRINDKSIIKKDDEKYKYYENNLVYKIKQPSKEDNKYLKNFVGTVIDKSDTSQIRFEYSSKKHITKGALLKVIAKNEKGDPVNVLYQVIEAVTEIKCFEHRNEIDLIVVSAIQFGVWKKEIRNFESYGWVPKVNTPVYLAENIEGPELEKGEIELGKIENTQFKVLVNVKDLVTHHTAILGATGTGKSVFARNIIKKIAEDKSKVFCIDLTGEIKKNVKTKNLIDFNKTFQVLSQDKTVGDCIKYVVEKRGVDYGKNPEGFGKYVEGIELYIKNEIEDFIEDTKNSVGVLELPELSNTEETLEYTKFFFKALFDLAKDGVFKQNQACIVLEEAHTLIPEWNFVGGTDDKTARRLTNTIAQIALQGRKYHVGLLVIAQRTANVSKTILTQCNTIIAFKQFDNTGKDFLSNQLGSELVKSLPTLKNRMAIISGKALISDVPIIFKVPELENEELSFIEDEKNRLLKKEEV